MGLNRIDSPKQLRRLSARVGKPVIRGYARWFDNQNDVLAFVTTTEAYVVPKIGDVEPYTDEPIELVEYGVRTRQKGNE